MIILGFLSFYFTKTFLCADELKRQNDILQVAKISLETFRSINTNLIINLEKSILEEPYENLNSMDALISNIGPTLKSYRKASGVLSTFIGLDNGENIVSDESIVFYLMKMEKFLSPKTLNYLILL